MKQTGQTIQTLTLGELRIGDKLIDPTNGEIKYSLYNDTHAVMFVTDRALVKMIMHAEERNTNTKE